MRGEYRVRHPVLRPLYEQAHSLYRQFTEARIEHNLRHKNALADKLANLAMDRKADVTDVDSDPSPAAAPAATEPRAGDRVHCPRCRCEIEIKQPSTIRPHQLKPFVCQCGAKMNGPESV